MSRKKKAGKKTAKKRSLRNSAPSAQQSATPQKSLRRVSILTWLVLPLVLSVFTIVLWLRSPREPVPFVIASKNPPTSGATFVGSDACATCHLRENTRWRGSHHQLAMQPAADSTVLGDFNNASFRNNGITSTFFRRDSKFMVRTNGPDGSLHDYEIKYTFGVYPLQQYLIPMPGGRLQALGIAWDTRPRERGGQRWFFLYPGQSVSTFNPLHWASIDQTWNYQCADCHSTNLRRNYNLGTRTYATSYSESNVACEACHGPGSNHLVWANKQDDWKKFNADHGLTISLDERQGATWSIDPTTGNPQRSVPRASEREIQMCARCHSRRGEIREDYVHGQPVGDDYRVALIGQDLYFPDGQIKGEVYEYGSFIQSRMFHAGVTCSDCHEAHSLILRADGNNICLQCHSAVKYDSTKHHFHPMGSRVARCVECHMPTRTYMVIDARRDHSLRIPRPDLSVKLGTPNACTNCHTDKSSTWASAAVAKWYGRTPKGFERFAEVIDAGSIGAPGAAQALGALVNDREQPAIARATALSMLANYDPPPTDAAIHTGITDDSALVRRAAARALSNSNGATGAILAPLLNDPVRAVRIETAEVLAGTHTDTLPPDVAATFARATGEYIAAQELNADRPEAHMNLGLLYAKENHFEKAKSEFKIALSLDPAFAPAAVDLADLYRAQNQDREGERTLRDAIDRSPNDASLQHALGLLFVRHKREAQALRSLAAATRIDPGNARYAYVYAVALNEAGQADAAIATLEACVMVHPFDRDSLAALVGFLEQAGNPAKALTYAQRLEELEPADPTVQQTIKALLPPRDSR